MNKKREFVCQLLYKKYPELYANGGVITLKQIQTWWEEYKDSPDRRVGFPLWLIGDQQFRGTKRGCYIVPLPTSEHISTDKWKNKSKSKLVVDQKHDIIIDQDQEQEQECITDDPKILDEFEQFLTEAGIQ